MVERAVLIERETEAEEDQQGRKDRDDIGRFKPGNKGRPPGIPNKLTRDKRIAAEEALARIGFDGQGLAGYQGYVEALCRCSDAAGITLVSRLTPTQASVDLAVTQDPPPRTFETVEELEAELQARGYKDRFEFARTVVDILCPSFPSEQQEEREAKWHQAFGDRSSAELAGYSHKREGTPEHALYRHFLLGDWLKQNHPLPLPNGHLTE